MSINILKLKILTDQNSLFYKVFNKQNEKIFTLQASQIDSSACAKIPINLLGVHTIAKYTREKIIDAFFALALENPEKSNFTVPEIASKTGISRQAIYQKHFKNLNEIILYIHSLVDKEICRVFNNYDPSSDTNPLDCIAENVLPAIWKGRQWIRCLYTTSIDPNFEDFIVSTYTKWGASNIVPKKGQFNLSNEEVAQLVTSLTVVVVKNWITQDSPSPPKQFKEELLRLIRTPIYKYINYTAVTVSD